jgi:serine protease Do
MITDGFGDIVEKLRRATVQVRPHRNAGGSGVIWAREGQIVTNAHVVEGGSGSVEIGLWDGRSLAAKIIKKDRGRDLAVLQLDAAGLPAAVPGDSRKLRAGELVIAVGNPLGFIGAASTGVVHQVEQGSWVVSHLRLAPGNSGGPLANARGEVVGINTMIAGGLALSIPSHAVKKFLGASSEEDAGLGVVVRPVLVAQSPRQFGLIVLEVTPNSPADRASLLQGDLLLGAGGKRFQSVQDLESAIDANKGKLLEVQFRRGASESVRAVAVQMAAGAMKAA